MIRSETSTSIFKCPKSSCNNEFRANIVKHKGGANDYGWWIIKCERCNHIFSKYIGRDVNDSNLTDGGKVLKKCDKDVASKKEVESYVKGLKKRMVFHK